MRRAPIEREPQAGFAKHGYTQSGSASAVAISACRNVGKPLATNHSCVRRLSLAIAIVSASETMISMPCDKKVSRASDNMGNSVSIVGITQRTSLFWHVRNMASTKWGSQTLGTMACRSASTKAGANGCASAATTCASMPRSRNVRFHIWRSSTRRPAHDKRRLLGILTSLLLSAHEFGHRIGIGVSYAASLEYDGNGFE